MEFYAISECKSCQLLHTRDVKENIAIVRRQAGALVQRKSGISDWLITRSEANAKHVAAGRLTVLKESSR
jgi:hypothetical protein